MPRFNIGDYVWTVGTESYTRTEACPDCLGQKAVTVILGDGSHVSVDCGCGHGFDGPKGYVESHVSRLESTQRKVTGIEITGDDVEYKLEGTGCTYYRAKEANVFATKEDAAPRLRELEAEDEAEWQKRLMWQKEDNRRTWAWNTKYHRECLKRAERDIAYHSKKLNVAKSKLKETSNDQP